MIRHAIVIVIALAAIPSPAAAQQSGATTLPALRGNRVSIVLEGGQAVQGKVEEQSADVLVVAGTRLNIDRIRQLDVADSNTSGAIGGFVAGAFVGIFGGAIRNELPGPEASTELGGRRPHEARNLMIGGLAFGAVGALIGAGIDAAHPVYSRRLLITTPHAVFAPVLTIKSVGVAGTVRW